MFIWDSHYYRPLPSKEEVEDGCDEENFTKAENAVATTKAARLLSFVVIAIAITALVSAAKLGVDRQQLKPRTPEEREQYSSQIRSKSSAQKPVDIVHVVLDDVGHNDLWASSDLNVSMVTPRITRLARQALLLSNYYGQSYCTPARGAMMTGKFVHKLGFAGDDSSGGTVEIKALTNYSLPLGHQLLPELLRDNGYATHAIGKWNVGHCHENYLPWNRGFDTFLGYFSSGIHYVTHAADTVFSHAGRMGFIDLNSTSYAVVDFQLYEGQNTAFAWDSAATRFSGEYSTTRFTRAATSRVVDAVSERADNASSSPPYYLYVSYHGMHDDAGVDDIDLDDFEDAAAITGVSSGRRVAFARGLAKIDRGVGAIAQALENFSGGEKDDHRAWILVLHSDNGGWPCGDYCAGNNEPLRGAKFFDFDGALKIPAFIYSPGLLRTQRDFTTYTKLTHHVDWLATFAAIAGVDVEGLLASDDFDSKNHWPTMIEAAEGGLQVSDDYNPRDEIIFSVDSSTATIRKRQFKIMLNRSDVGFYLPNATDLPSCNAPSSEHWLFNVEEDPHEKNNLWHVPEYANVANDLKELAQRKYQLEFFHIPYPRSSELNFDIEQALLKSSSKRTKILVPWACGIIEREFRR